ncbi:uncharacterized protein LOC110924017 [Helianthus annuus]|uniref:uncharacterized protein LOC110924017 n=1 Tax=Helianthus annuus TaxID=4232 RepID=UPI000B8EF1A5|nr:uncharacterized protein LOC110924017 [Helianthus annuus]
MENPISIHNNRIELDPEVQNAMSINDEQEEAFYQRVAAEDLESQNRMFEVSTSGNHALLTVLTQYGDQGAGEKQKSNMMEKNALNEAKKAMAEKLDGAYKELEDSYNKMKTFYMAGSDEVNSRPVENHDNAKIQLTGAELKALVDNAVTKALERQCSEYSGTHSRTLSTPHNKSKTHSEAHSKPPSVKPKSKKEESKKEDDRHSSNENDNHSKKIVLYNAPRAKVRQRSLRAADAEKRKREDDGSRRSDKKRKGNDDHKKGSGSKKGDQQSGEKPRCKNMSTFMDENTKEGPSERAENENDVDDAEVEGGKKSEREGDGGTEIEGEREVEIAWEGDQNSMTSNEACERYQNTIPVERGNAISVDQHAMNDEAASEGEWLAEGDIDQNAMTVEGVAHVRLHLRMKLVM